MNIKVIYSEEDKGYIATCEKYPSISAFGVTEKIAIEEMKIVYAEVEDDLKPTYLTPKQWEAREGRPWPKEGPVYAFFSGKWFLGQHNIALHQGATKIICCTTDAILAGKPPADYVPEVEG